MLRLLLRKSRAILHVCDRVLPLSAHAASPLSLDLHLEVDISDELDPMQSSYFQLLLLYFLGSDSIYCLLLMEVLNNVLSSYISTMRSLGGVV
jgi:hypothetical protein